MLVCTLKRLKIRGSFTVKCDSEKAFEVLVGALGELKAKVNDIDTLRHKIDGKSRATALRWGTKFHARVIKHFADNVVEIYNIALITDDTFIKKVYSTFTKYQPASPLEIEFFVQIHDYKGEAGERLDDAPMPSGGAPSLLADISDRAGHQAGMICAQCGASNLPDSAFCNKCGSSLTLCPGCGHITKEGLSFCTKWGTKLG